MKKSITIRSCLISFLFLLVIIPAGCQQPQGPIGVEERVRDTSQAEVPLTGLSEETYGVIAALGDSLTAGLGVAGDLTYPALLEQKLKEKSYLYHVINAGVSGDTSAGGLRRLEWVLKNRPEIVILELGVNDGLRGLSLTQIHQNLTTIIEGLQKAGVKVVLAGMKLPLNYGEEYTQGFQKIYPELSQRYHLPLIPFFLEGVAARVDLNQADGIHPTGQGYRVIVDNLWPVLEPLLTKR
jgi:acyl-CoA thioesterase-1